MSQTPLPALFRFVGVRRPALPQPTLPVPDDDVTGKAFDFTDALLPVVAQVLHRDDREAAQKLVATLLHQLSKQLSAAAAKMRKLRRQASVDDALTLGDIRPFLATGPPTTVLHDLAIRAATVIVLERWLGAANSPQIANAAGILRGIAIARLASTSLQDGYAVADLVHGQQIELPDVVHEADPKPEPSLQPHRVREGLRRLTSRAAALGHGDDPALDTLRGQGFGDLSRHAELTAEAAHRIGLPPDAPASSLARILDVEVSEHPYNGPATLPGSVGVPLQPASLPVLSGRARVLGRGDLMVVRISHLRYKTNEIAYIENVLKSELRGRTVIVDTRTSERVETSTDVLSESTHELTTDERFGLQDAATSANTATTSMSAGMNISGGFGPVNVGIDVSASHSSTTSESNSSSSDYAKDVTDRATETMRNESSTRTITTTRQRVAETNKHDFDNRTGTGHVRGIYRWLDKVDLCQVYNYGERLLLEFVMPEPAAQYVYLATTAAAAAAGGPAQPAALDFGPRDITEHNFVAFGRRYDTAGLQRPPVPVVTVPATFSFPAAQPTNEVNPDPDDKNAPPEMAANSVITGEVSIPDGYAAGSVVVSVAYGGTYATVGEGSLLVPVGVPVDQEPVNISAGGQRITIKAFSSPESQVIELPTRLTGSLPIAIGSQQKYGQAIAIRVIAHRSAEAFKAWQHSTFALIQQAYLSQLSDYENAQNIAALRQGYTAVTPTDVNRGIENRELTRGCQTILTGQDFTLFGSVEFAEAGTPPPGDLPGIDLDEAWIESDVIQFFSDVMEWSLMTYVFYPFQWAGRHRWAELSARISADPLHQSFLQAGAARVVVPVREGFEHAIARYLKTGDIPSWGPEPWRGRPANYPRVDELIADANDRPQGEVAVGEPWEVVTPTTLVYLQEDAELNPVAA